MGFAVLFHGATVSYGTTGVLGWRRWPRGQHSSEWRDLAWNAAALRWWPRQSQIVWDWELETYRQWSMYLDDLSCCGKECVC